MAELANCPQCDALFMKNNLRDVCDKCYKEEEKMFETVYKFIRKRENRTATHEMVIEATGVDDELLYKWVRKGRLQPAQFPNLGYPCESCGTMITTARLCRSCSTGIQNDLEVHEKEEQRKIEQNQRTYLSR